MILWPAARFYDHRASNVKNAVTNLLYEVMYCLALPCTWRCTCVNCYGAICDILALPYIPLLALRCFDLVRYHTTSTKVSVIRRVHCTPSPYTSAAGVPYHVRVYAENINGRGSYCITTDFGDQLSGSTLQVNLAVRL